MPMIRPTGTLASSEGWPGYAMTGGKCPARQMSIRSSPGSMTAYSTVAIASASKYCIFRSSLLSTSAGSRVSRA